MLIIYIIIIHTINVKRYVGIAVDVYDENEVKFILSIDFVDDFDFGDNNTEEEVKQFIENYLIAYISISYLLNLNNKKQIPEV